MIVKIAIIIIIINDFIHHKIKTTYLMLNNWNPNKYSSRSHVKIIFIS